MEVCFWSDDDGDVDQSRGDKGLPVLVPLCRVDVLDGDVLPALRGDGSAPAVL